MAVELEGELTVDRNEWNLETLEDELRVDRLCQKLLKHFYIELMEKGASPEQATLLASSADYFVRDFVVAIRRQNLFGEKAGLVRQFAGNWYIVSNLEPNTTELTRHLEGIRTFYRFLRARRLVSQEYLDRVEQECDDMGYYGGRIESFWEIKGDGYTAWERECSLKEG